MRTKTSRILLLSCLALVIGAGGGRGGRPPGRSTGSGTDDSAATQLPPTRVPAAGPDCDAPPPAPQPRGRRPVVETCAEATP